MNWKQERIRRQNIKRQRKQISHDFAVWSERLKEATLQTLYHSFTLNNVKRGNNEPKSDK